MNDPGLDDPISNAGQQVDGHYQDDNNNSDLEEEEEENNFLLPSRWWFASTAFPLLAGTFGPMANAFNICALVQNWRVSIPPGGTEEHGIDHKDPPWLIAVNAVSLIFALIANLALLLNMARRLRFSIAQPITIAGFYMACFLLVGLVSVTGGGYIRLPGAADQALTQAYYYAIFAAALYFIIAWLMMFTVWGAHKGHYSKEFKLTISQRTLMLQTISYFVYLLLGALVYSRIEKWRFLDAIYFANFTLLTVGVGDYTPATHAGRSILFPFAFGGIVILGLVVGSIRSLVLDRGKKKLSSRNFEKTRKAVLKRLSEDDGVWHRGHILAKKVKAQEPEFSLDPQKKKELEVQRRESEFNIMREIQNMSAAERKWVSLFTSSSIAFMLWFFGAVIFWVAERNQNWSYFQSLYFAYVSLLTIGYGDFSPMSNSGKPFFVLWSLLAVPALTILISNMGDTVVKGIKDITLVLGELTVLPSEEGSVGERVKIGIHQVTGGQFKVGNGARQAEQRIQGDEEQMDEESQGVVERAPGISTEPKRTGEGPGDGSGQEKDAAALDRLAGGIERREAEEASEAHDKGDMKTEDEHHYRYLLIHEIRNVYADVGATPPVRYKYEKWCYYLSLLGEDESSHQYHRAAPTDLEKTTSDSGSGPEIEGAVPIGNITSSAAKENTTSSTQGTTDSDETSPPTSSSSLRADDPVNANQDQKEKQKQKQPKIAPWSWIGNRSPLMGDKDEAEWLLERLVAQLEAELLQARKAGQEDRRRRGKTEGKNKMDDGGRAGAMCRSEGH